MEVNVEKGKIVLRDEGGSRFVVYSNMCCICGPNGLGVAKEV